MAQKILLTGAGFTRNFGLPLARQVWGMIFNDSKIQSTTLIRQALLSNDNYEELYSKVITDDLYREERKSFLERINIVFNDIFESSCVNAFENSSGYGISYQCLFHFIKLFTKREESNFLFTTNQDLFLERLFEKYNDMLGLPYMDNCLHNNYHGNRRSCPLKNTLSSLRNCSSYFKNDGGWLPEKESVQMLKNSTSPHAYFKLHGSIGWRKKDIAIENLPLVMGTNKTKLIEEEPLFEEYLKIFSDALNQQNTSLLAIGYSFSDKHLNNVVLNSIQNHGLKVHVVDPVSINCFRDALKSEDKFGELWEVFYQGLHGYYEATLRDIFPLSSENVLHNGISSQSEIWKMLKANFFGF